MLLLELSALYNLKICRFLGSNLLVLSARGKALRIIKSVKPLSAFRGVFLVHQRHTAWETYHGNRGCKYRKIQL